MKLIRPDGSALWLAYCMNVHPGGTLASTAEALARTVLPLKARLGVEGPFGIGVRFADPAAEGTQAFPERFARVEKLLVEHDLVPFTGNAFVMGEFHARHVKEKVYEPDWTRRARVDYTVRSAALLTMMRIAGPAGPRSVSTAPGSWKAWGHGPDVDRACARNLVEVGKQLAEWAQQRGKVVRLALEPEPGCTLETVDDAIRFFQGPLAKALETCPPAKDHLGLCYDVCHQAVVHEDPDEGLDRLEAAGVPVFKVQASCALEVDDPADEAARRAVAAFAEPVYLHQVGARDADGALHVADDLPAALEDDRWRSRAPWRVHFHVPVFRREAVPPLGTTRPFLDRVLQRIAAGGVTDHLEIETYTWDVLPQAEREAGSGTDLVEALAKEYESVLEVLGSHGVTRAVPESAS